MAQPGFPAPRNLKESLNSNGLWWDPLIWLRIETAFAVSSIREPTCWNSGCSTLVHKTTDFLVRTTAKPAIFLTTLHYPDHGGLTVQWGTSAKYRESGCHRRQVSPF